jgi:flagellar basal-body rod modification protein FlgD
MANVAALGSALLGTSGQSAATASRSTLNQTFDTFLTLLTKQLQNQDPLDPVKSNEFTQQLVMFTSAEQQVATNKNLESLIKLTQANQSAVAVGYLGKVVLAAGDTTALSNGSATWNYTLPKTAVKVTLTITDSAGKMVASSLGENSAGTHTFVWAGRDFNGNVLPNGTYKMSVGAKDSEGVAISATTAMAGVVDGVEKTDTGIILTIGGVRVPIENITSVTAPPAPRTAPAV